MSKKIRFLFYFVFLGAATSVALLADQGWLERMFPKKEPQVVTTTSKPLIEPPANVLALQDAFAKVAETVKPAVVNISAVQITRVEENPYQFYYGDPDEFFRQFFGGEPSPQQKPRTRELRQEATGSGVIIDPEGYILTNNHVVQNADQLTVTLSDDKVYKGKVVGTDSRTDLAVIRIKGSSPFPYVPLADSSKARIGDWVLAIGSPFGLQQTVTSGIVSAIRQSLNIEGRVFRNLLQTDAAINRGNSGGALVDIRGQLVGINTAIYAPTGVFSGIGFAIPVNDAKLVLKDLIQKGFVERSWMGVEIVQVDDVIASQFGLASAEGALINQVVDNSPADKAGLRRGDIIIEFDGKKVTTVQALQDQVSATPAGHNVPVKVVRGSETKTLSLKTEALPKEPGEPAAEREPEKKSKADQTIEWLGASFSELSPGMKERFGLRRDGTSVGSGVILTDVPSGSPAMEAGLREGDIMQAVNRLPIQTLDDIKKMKSSVDLKKGVVFDVLRQGKSFYLTYKSLQ